MTEEKPRYRWFILGLLMSISLVHGIGMGVVPALLGEIKGALGLTHAQGGAILGATALGTVLTVFLGGTVGDRFGVKRVIGAGLLFAAMTIALRAIFPSFQGLVVSMLLYGMSLGFILPNSSKTVGMW